ncbi:MAG: hypothetical protein KJ690_15650 [Alphaproteobacteria bacterium]|uniref:hypothetical protein n=1 Tax=Brevundimonas sp. TaxID=1871086 RepID=UPI001817CAD5|nr:hypothetical protein [Brevundimonas sp.]MBA3041272.1 hypothetical protein [Rhizobiaceae bacterium]MBA3049502.1 hypothetical protein [Brevundimonas sp.]MBU4040839.1 hypothetical protein [Alphaproteobacteria bacterium]MBU4137837.1 hypothetical protein [Alphaproteobacteria bacterium]
MFLFVGERFWGRASGVTYTDLSLIDCEFNSCGVERDTGDPRNHIERISVMGAAQLNCSIADALIRDVTIQDLRKLGSAPLFLWGCLFERVTLSGRISAIKINQTVGLPNAPADRQRVHNSGAIEFYSSSDWALDISQAEFPGGVTFDAIPGDKVRRDPDRQVIVSRAGLARSDWRAIDFDGTAIDYALSWFEQEGLFDSVVLAERSDRKWAKRDHAVLRRLCDAGIGLA